VFFDSDSAELSPQTRRMLDFVVIQGLKPGRDVLVEAHADTEGSPAASLAVSQARADAIVAYLISKGISRERIGVAVFGDASPLIKTGAGVPQAQNRRAVVQASDFRRTYAARCEPPKAEAPDFCARNKAWFERFKF
jgi:outer membrane protein OmpA-like peptidoglycan-associated protein